MRELFNDKWVWVAALVVFILVCVLLFTKPAGAHYNCNEDNYKDCSYPTVTPTPTEPCLAPGDEDVQVACVTPMLSPSPSATPSATPTDTPSSSGSSGSQGGTGVSDGLSSCPNCTLAPAVPTGVPETGHALY